MRAPKSVKQRTASACSRSLTVLLIHGNSSLHLHTPHSIYTWRIEDVIWPGHRPVQCSRTAARLAAEAMIDAREDGGGARRTRPRCPHVTAIIIRFRLHFILPPEDEDPGPAASQAPPWHGPFARASCSAGLASPHEIDLVGGVSRSEQARSIACIVAFAVPTPLQSAPSPRTAGRGAELNPSGLPCFHACNGGRFRVGGLDTPAASLRWQLEDRHFKARKSVPICTHARTRHLRRTRRELRRADKRGRHMGQIRGATGQSRSGRGALSQPRTDTRTLPLV